MTEPVWLLKPAIIAVHGMLIARFGGADGIRDEALLDSALNRPVNIYHYDGITDVAALAAAYSAGLIQNQPFIDGNKRIGFIAAYMFLDLNGATLVADEISATITTLSLAASQIGEKEYASWLADKIRIA